MSLFDALNTAQQGMSVHRFRSEVAAENLTNVFTPGYQAKRVVLSPSSSFGATLRTVTGTGTALTRSGPMDTARGAVRVAGIRTEAGGIDDYRGQAMTGVVEMMQSKSAYELSMRAATMLKSMALGALEIGRGS